tara:strand:- start:115 stop:378 length:264 start_codon:yes stop_codon:yes gene_type:complete
MSPTYLEGDTVTLQKIQPSQSVDINDIVVLMHPLKRNIKLIKRVTKIRDDSKIFVEGDNPDVLSTDDSHNFGYVNKSDLIAIKKNQK